MVLWIHRRRVQENFSERTVTEGNVSGTNDTSSLSCHVTPFWREAGRIHQHTAMAADRAAPTLHRSTVPLEGEVRRLAWGSCSGKVSWLVLWRGTRPAIVAVAPRGVARQPSVPVLGQNDSTARMEVIVTEVEANSNIYARNVPFLTQTGSKSLWAKF